MTVSVLVPLAEPNDPIREAHWRWLRRRWEALLPASWEVVEGRAPADPWCKANAVQAASQAALHRTWIVLDADVILDPEVLVEAADLVADGAPWVHPHHCIYRLNEYVTEQVVAQPPVEPCNLPTNRSALDRQIYRSGAGGGCVVLSADAYRTSGGIDPRFLGWGGEDVAFGWALLALVGEPVLLPSPLWHLWHPPQGEPLHPHSIQRRTSQASDELARRYKAACRDRQSMAALVAEHQGVTT